MELFKEVQNKDIGRRFYPDNLWTTGPDGHLYMLGIPDDEANMLLFVDAAAASRTRAMDR